MLTGLTLPQVALLLGCGVLLDLLLGEARRWHPLVGFGNLAKRIEALLNRGSPGAARYLRGATAWALAVLPLSAVAAWACGLGGTGGLGSPPGPAGLVLHATLLYFCIGFRSLREHNLPIADALARGDLATARTLTGYIVSRDTATASEGDLAKASAESLLENGNDAVFGTLFWFVLAGGGGAVLFRLANTLDAMWGYRSTRFLQFGWAAARIDDVLNVVPARLTALSYVLLAADRGLAWRCWRSQAPAWPSPNAGPVMASGAGALGLALGGKASYDGVIEERPPLGLGRAADAGDIRRAWKLVETATALWVAAIGTAALAVLLWGALHA